MKTRFCLLAAFSTSLLWGTYTYDLNLSNVVVPGYSTSNGSVTGVAGVPTVSFPSPGSYISALSIPGTPNDYEINTPITLGTGGGTYVHYLRASSNALASPGSCTGTYISVEIAVPATYVATGDQAAAAQLNINQCVSGSLTNLAYAALTVPHSATLRSVISGTTLIVFVDNRRLWGQTVSIATGLPGFGGYGLTAPASFSWGYAGHLDTLVPSAPPATGFRSRLLPYQVSLEWQGAADDANGIGVFAYSVARNGVWLGLYDGAELGDSTVTPATAYTYAVAAVDFHGNVGPATSYSVTTPAAATGDPRRTGVVSTGSYWGGGGEQIDLLSGNLNYSLPLLNATGRAGNKIQLNLSYNSQNWAQDSGSNWRLGSDIGYGFGWQVQLGSITPYYLPWPAGVDHYIFTDNSGAEYRLDQHTGSVWSSTQGIYVWFDADSNLLHFKDGSFWVMGALSSGAEVDAGTLYPTILEDVNGNEILVTYQAGAGLPSAAGSTSGRILLIQDSREVLLPPYSYSSYSFSYNTDPVPHLTGITNYLGTSETYTFGYAAGAALMPPFGADPAYAGLTTTHLASITVPGGAYQFTYDPAGAAELTQVQFPWGGHLRWDYATAHYATSRSLREISNRYLAADSAGAVEWTYPITHSDSGTTIPTVHADAALADASGNGSKAWTFLTSGAAWQIGLASDFYQKTNVSGAVITHDAYTWSQTSSSNPYTSMKVSDTDPGTGSALSAKSTQTLDGYGNVTQSVIYPYNDPVNPLRTLDSEYITDAGYVANYVRNRLLRTRLTLPGGAVKTVANYYDGKIFGYQIANPCIGYYAGSPLPPPPGGGPSGQTALFDPSPLPFNSRGLLDGTVSSSASNCNLYYAWGVPAQTTDTVTGESVSMTPSSNSGWSLPSVITGQTYSESLSYNSWLGLTGTTGLNGETMSMTYDGTGRPATANSPYNTSGTPTITYTYSASGAVPAWQAKTGPDGYTKTTLDGLGRAIKVERGPNSTTIQSEVDTVYAPCACSPMAKLQKTSMPYAPGGSPAWTSYVYDGIGRTVGSTLPDGASTTAYAYAGNQTTVTDPAGKWKKYTNDVQGNLIAVTEPDPANPTTATFTTSYTYDWMNHLYTSTMTRGGTTQTRTFVYNDAGLLTSATNPENGTVTYSYNANKTLVQKHDAKGQDVYYSYDSYRRVTDELYYKPGIYAEAACEHISYSYDTNPYDPSFSHYAAGRLTAVRYGDPNPTPGYYCNGGASSFVVNGGGYTEMYSYHRAGGVTAKRLQVLRPSENDIAFDWYYPDGSATQDESGTITLDVDYTYDDAGRRNSITYPTASARYDGATFTPMQPSTFTTTYDAMGRPLQVASSTGGWQAYSAQYDVAGRMTSVTDTVLDITLGYPSVTKAMTYNVNGQMTSQTWTSYGGGWLGSLTYAYSGTQNNGQITQVTDWLSGETVAYQYDALKRLTSAAATPNSGSTPAAWTQTYQYDGFGNLTAKVLNGATSSIAVDAATNRLSGGSYDNNGNWTAGGSYGYDGRDRMVSTNWPYSFSYGYDPQNHRTYQSLDGNPIHPGTLTLYGAYGERLATYGFLGPYSSGAGPIQYETNVLKVNVWFNGQIVSGDTTYFQDRLGTDRSGGAQYRPYGEEITSTSNNRVKFGTYTRDSTTGLDYADQRYYASVSGRFNTADPYQASAGPSDPGSWNRYAYVEGDPVNHMDRRGLCVEDLSTGYFYNGYAEQQEAAYSGIEGAGFNDNLAEMANCSGDLGFAGGGSIGGGGGGGWSVDPCAQIETAVFEGGVTCNGPIVAPVFFAPPKRPTSTRRDSIHCQGTARVLQGNAATIGSPGGFSGSSIGNFPVTATGAAVIVSQWADSKSTLRQYIDQISGVFPGVEVAFTGIVDVVGGKPPKGFPADSNVGEDLMALYPGQLIIELPGAMKDYGSTSVILTVPSALDCPQGTTKVP